MIGLAFGIAAGAWRDFADRVFRTRNQVEDLLRTECIAIVPLVKKAATQEVDGPLSKAAAAGRVQQPQRNEVATKASLAETPRLLQPGPQIIEPKPGIYSIIQEEPFSAFAEAIRSIKVAIDLERTGVGGKIIGFTSSLPNEGKSSVRCPRPGWRHSLVQRPY